ncbi:hypothetical protein [Pseudoxanthomonas suwonensis]|uniref:Secreted protein n=1 Tax=Pseudoxanthomonas suwonensis TaxID=314722 RepID=A0A0E3UMV2_9GAMM|nr:hypothetical protein [Pseudoxanthomonas suwonensis]AKC86626.1 hypothetical protein WQ53_07440 [Pseudoxanthomonas suwonensis]
MAASASGRGTAARGGSRLLGVLACLALAVASGAGGAAEPAGDAFDALQAVDLHRGAVAQAMRQIDAAEQRGEAVPERLRRIRHELYPLLSWGRITADGSIVAIDPGRRDGVWGLVLDRGHPLLAVPMPTLTTLDLDGIHAVRIRPDPMTGPWAGVFLVHELSHVLDQRDGVARDPACRAEFSAYVAERQYYDLANAGRLSTELDRTIDLLGLRHPQDVVRLFVTDAERLGDALAALELRLGEPPAASAAEREMRDGFYYVSLVDRLGARTGLADAERCAGMEEAMRPASKY